MEIAEEIKDWLKEAGYALVPVRLTLGGAEETLFLVKASRDVLTKIKAGDALARLGWAVEATPGGPVVCALFDAAHGESARLTLESYFDPFDDADNAMLAEMAAQGKLRAALFDEETEIVGLVEIAWDEVARLVLEQALDRAEELAEIALLDGVTPDFEAACAFFRDETTIDKLADRIFGAG